MKYAKTLLAVAAAAITTVAVAAVTFDPVAGTGFVGKGDVQLAFGWNNKTLQDNAQQVQFAYDAVDQYTVVCEFDTGTGTNGQQTHLVPVSRNTIVSGEINGDPRKSNQFTGFNLKGFIGTPVTVGTVPVQGASCLGWGVKGTVASFSLVSSTGGLFAIFNGDRRALQ